MLSLMLYQKRYMYVDVTKDRLFDIHRNLLSLTNLLDFVHGERWRQ